MFEAFKTKDIIKHKQVEKHYTVEKVPCNLGGYKYFIKCYKCDNKCLKMYISENKKLVCSTCIGLRKQQLNRNKTDPTRYYKLMMKQCYKVDKNYNSSNVFVNSFLGFPCKPPRMKQEKYFEILNKYMYYRKKYYYYLKMQEEQGENDNERRTKK